MRFKSPDSSHGLTRISLVVSEHGKEAEREMAAHRRARHMRWLYYLYSHEN